MSESTYFRDVRLHEPDEEGDVRVDWTTPYGGVRTVWIYARHHGGADGAVAAATELHARLTSRLLDPLPEGMEHTVMASGADILRHEWEWRFSHRDKWRTVRTEAGNPADALSFECRPPQQPTTERVPWWWADGRRMPNGFVVEREATRNSYHPNGAVYANGVWFDADADGMVEVLTEGGES